MFAAQKHMTVMNKITVFLHIHIVCIYYILNSSGNSNNKLPELLSAFWVGTSCGCIGPEYNIIYNNLPNAIIIIYIEMQSHKRMPYASARLGGNANGWLTLLLRIREVPGSNLGPEIG
jgi:hypothetical protein